MTFQQIRSRQPNLLRLSDELLNKIEFMRDIKVDFSSKRRQFVIPFQQFTTFSIRVINRLLAPK